MFRRLYTGEKVYLTTTTPYDTVILPNVKLQVVGDRTIGDLNTSGANPLANVYESVGLGESEYDNAILNQIRIYTLVDDGGSTTYIPENYIQSETPGLLHDYKELTVGINLGLLPVDYDTDLLLTDIAALVETHINLIPGTKVVVSSTTIGLSDLEDLEVRTRLKNSPLTGCKYERDVCLENLRKVQAKLKAIVCTV